MNETDIIKSNMTKKSMPKKKTSIWFVIILIKQFRIVQSRIQTETNDYISNKCYINKRKNMRETYRMLSKLSKSKLNKLTQGNYFHELFEKMYEEYNDSRYNNIKHLLKK